MSAASGVDVDLDPVGPARPSPGGSRRSIPPVALILALCLTGLLGAVAVQAARAHPLPRPPSRVAATVELDSVALTPQPTGSLEVTVYNRERAAVRVVELVVSGSGLAGTEHSPVGQEVSPGAAGRFLVQVPVRCGTLVDSTGPPSVLVVVGASATSGGSTRSTTTVAAWPAGPAAAAGLCQSALAALPSGWSLPIQLRGFTTGPGSVAGPGSATVSITGLPSDTTGVSTVRAGAWTVPVHTVRGFGVDGVDGVVTLELGQPVPDCSTPSARPVLPVGLDVVLSRLVRGPVSGYLAVGPDLARWLLSAWRSACPDSPDGPPDGQAAGGPAVPVTNGHSND